MLKKLERLIDILMGAYTGAFLGGAVMRYLDAQKYQDVFVVDSAPWYAGLLPAGAVLAAVLLLGIAAKIVLRRKGR